MWRAWWLIWPNKVCARADGLLTGAMKTRFLAYLQEIVADGRSPAARLLDKYHGDWGGDITPIFKQTAL